MNISDDMLDQLRDYVAGDLNSQDALSLEKRIAERPELKSELDFTRKVMAEAGELERKRLLEMVEGVMGEEQESRITDGSKPFLRMNRKAFKPILGIAASLILLVVVGNWWMVSQNNNKLDDFSTTAYISPENVDLLRGGDSLPLASKPYQAFEEKQYQRSIDLIEAYPQDDSLYLHLLLLKGHNYYHLGQYGHASETLEKINILQASFPDLKPVNLDNVAWIRILALLEIYRDSDNKEDEEYLKAALDGFLLNADQEDEYYKKALNLAKILGHTKT